MKWNTHTHFNEVMFVVVICLGVHIEFHYGAMGMIEG